MNHNENENPFTPFSVPASSECSAPSTVISATPPELRGYFAPSTSAMSARLDSREVDELRALVQQARAVQHAPQLDANLLSHWRRLVDYAALIVERTGHANGR